MRQDLTRWSESETKLLTGFLILFQDVSLHELASFFTLRPEELMQIIVDLQEQQTFEVEFFNDNVVLLYHNLKFSPDPRQLTPEEIKLLGFLKGINSVTFRELAILMDLHDRQIKFLLADLIARGFIQDLTYYDADFRADLPPSLDLIGTRGLSEFHRNIIGYLLIRVNVSLQELSDELQEPYEKVVTELMKLVLSGVINVVFRLEWRMRRVTDIFTELVNYSPPPNPRDVSLLSSTERTILGYIAITENPRIDRLSQLFLFDRKTIIRIIARLSYEGKFNIFLTHGGHLIISKQFSFSPLGSIATLSATSIFDYHALVGFLEKKKSIKLKVLADQFHTSVRDIYKRIIDLYFTREIVGRIKGNVAYLSRAKVGQVRGVMSPLSTTDRILLGALIARKKLTWLDVSGLLTLDRETAIQKSYSLLAKSNAIVYIKNNRELRIKTNLRLPPLIQVRDLSETRKIVLGYCRNHSVVRCGKLAKIIERSKLDTLKVIYFLIGSGLIYARGKSMKLKIISVNSELPLLGVDELPGKLGEVGRRLSGVSGSISYKQLLSELDLRKVELLRLMYLLVADNYFTFRTSWNGIKRINYTRKEVHTPLCLNCGAELEDPSLPCTNCLVRPPPCVICRKGLTKLDSIASCPSCTQKGHEKHFRQWLAIKEECPRCRFPLTGSELLIERKNDP